MSSDSRLQLRVPVAIAMALSFLAIGALVSYVLTRPTPMIAGADLRSPQVASPSQAPAASAGVSGSNIAPLPDVAISLSEEAIKRAGIVVAAVESAPLTATLRLPAVVEPNAYKQVTVTPLVSGRVTKVLVELGAQVRQGQTMATVFSPELAESQTRFIAASAELDAHERELARTEKLVAIGSASRQELERIHAEHTAQRTNVDSARAKLELLGMSRESIDKLKGGTAVDASTDVPAPIAGVVTDTGVRDTMELIKLGLPVFSLSVCIKGTVKETLGQINGDIVFGGELVRPGDVIRGDADGLVVVRREDAAEVAVKSAAREAAEAGYIAAYKAGKSVIEVSNLAGAQGAATILYRPSGEVADLFRRTRTQRLFLIASTAADLARLIAQRPGAPGDRRD